MNIWKEKVLPKIKKVFEKNPGKKAAIAEVVKAFEESKEQYSTEFEQKKTDLQSKVVEIYETALAEVKGLVKEPKNAGLKKHSAAVQKFLDELAKIDFPGAKAVSEAATKFGPSYVSGPVTFLFEKVSTYIPKDVKKEEEAPAAETTATTEEVKEKEIEVEAEKKEEVVVETAAEKVEVPPAEATPAAEATEAAKVEEAPPAPAAEPPKA
ncbi:hypothetical protein ACH5RR_016053 [Cinchona calisaya]|uniref:Plasma membrane-associated cation-binding protein 1 n=1 Tax=Cinchona calisaya TaxID=153742 RepID=A0ABD2ZVT0_9GENT